MNSEYGQWREQGYHASAFGVCWKLSVVAYADIPEILDYRGNACF